VTVTAVGTGNYDNSLESNPTTATTTALSLQSVTDLTIGISGRTLTTQPQIQLKVGSSNHPIDGVTVTAFVSAGSSLSGTTTAVTNSSGLATFSNLGLDTGTVGESYTLTFSAANYVTTTDALTLKTLPTQILIASTAPVNGGFIDGHWYADSATSSTIQDSALATQLNSRSVLIEAVSLTNNSASEGDGGIDITGVVSKTAGSNQTLTLKATKSIYVRAEARLASSSNGLNVVFWSDSDGVNGGLVNILGGSSSHSVATNGGHLAIGGGSSPTSWQGLTIPSGYSDGNAQFTSDWFGVLLGMSQNVNDRKLISTNNGNLRIFGRTTASPGVSELHGIAWEGGEISTGTGSVDLNGTTSGNPSTTNNPNFGVGIGVNFVHASDVPKLVTSGAVLIEGTTASTTSTNHQGVSIRGADFNAGSSAITITSSRQAQLAAGNTFRSRFNLSTSSGQVAVSGLQTWGVSTTGTVAEISSSSSIVKTSALFCLIVFSTSACFSITSLW
jgi:hypothetical protein